MTGCLQRWTPFYFLFWGGDRVLAALDAFLLPALPTHDSLYLEHSMLRLAAWRRYGTYIIYIYIMYMRHAARSEYSTQPV